MKNLKKTLCLFLALVMCLGMVNIGALAAEDGGQPASTEQTEQTTNPTEPTEPTESEPVESEQPEPTESTNPTESTKPTESEPVESEQPEPTESTNPTELAKSSASSEAVVVSEEAEDKTPAEVQAFLDAVAAVPEKITEENWEDAQAKVDEAFDLYSVVYDLWETKAITWTKELSDAYQVLEAAGQTIFGIKLVAYPITGEWSDENGAKVLTLTGTGESSYTGTFVLVEDGERVKFVSNLRSDNKLDPFRVVLVNITEIGDGAFNSCKKLTGINLGAVTTIGQGAFRSAFDPDADVTITLNNAAVGEYAFYQSKIDHLNAAGLTAISKQAFLGTTVQDVAIGIADGAELSQDFFYQSTQLKTLTLNGNVAVKNAFRGCSALKAVALNNVTEIGESAFMDCSKLETVTGLDAVTHIGFRGFYRCAALTTVGLSGVKTIGYEAFSGSNLSGDYDLSGAEYIEFNAFKGCENANITVGKNTVLEHSDVFSDIPGLQDRIVAILANRFTLKPANAIETLNPLGWTSSKIGAKNDTETYGGTQITKEARWANSNNTVADVTIQAYYTDEAQMDFIFVLDLSNSMAKVGNTEAGDKNARLYDMQSKLLDVTGKLMTAPGYDCHVAFTGFGETSSQTSGKFFTEANEAAAYINGLQTYYENTNYGLGLEKAKALVDANKGRNTTVVFISDGQPWAGTGKQVPAGYYGYEEAKAIKDAGVEIYAVLQSIPEGELENAKAVMTKICTDGKFFTATETEKFSIAVNNAIACGFTTYTLVDTVGDDFDLVNGSINVSVGEAVYDPATRTITWTITGMPFVTHTLTFQERLHENLVDRVGTFTYDTNKGSATMDGDVNAVETPQLTRTVGTSGGDDTTTYKVTYRWTGLPEEAAARLPGSGSYAEGANVTVNTTYAEGTELTMDGTVYVFSGWNMKDFKMPSHDVTITGVWTTNITDDNPPTTDITDNDVPLANVDDKLNTTDHFAYVIGYPEGDVRPENSITRAEAVTIFFRLMTDEFRSANWTTANAYTDVEAGQWFNNAISTASKAGLFQGYEDDTARPNNAITRAEFATLAARFISGQITDDGAGDFADTADHWAASYIRLAVKAGWIQGVGGNRFEPDRNITRAEVMTIVNRMLDRVADKDHMLSDMKTWSDNPTTAWYYEAVQEATNGHDYERLEDGMTEQWTKLQAPRDWAALETEWATAESGK